MDSRAGVCEWLKGVYVWKDFGNEQIRWKVKFHIPWGFAFWEFPICKNTDPLLFDIGIVQQRMLLTTRFYKD